jgi:transposase
MPGTKYSAELRAKAVRLVREHAGDYPSEWAAIGEVSRRLGIGSSETLRKWLRQAETDEGSRPGTTTEQASEVRALKRKVSELERTIQILTEATRFFAREADPLRR